MGSVKVGSWKLTDLVKDPSGDAFRIFSESIEAQVKQLESKRKDLLSNISSQDFENVIHLIEEIYEKVSIVNGYAHLRYYADTSSNEAAALVSKMEKLGSDIANRMLFFDLWFKREIDEENAERLINSVPYDYKEYLKHKRLLAKYALSAPEEKIINTLNVTGTKALVKIYDKMASGFEFTMKVEKGRKIIEKRFSNKTKLLSLIRSTKREERESAYKALWKVYKKNSSVLGEIYQTTVNRWRDEGISMRGYKSPISIRNAINNVNDETVDTLLSVCKRNVTIFQQYFKEKAKMFGVKKLSRYDLYAPLTSKQSHQKTFAYGKAIDTLLETFEDFDPLFRKFAERVFAEQHVDSAIRNGKRDGAFCYTVSPKITPYILLNFDGKTKDIFTLAHELGHAIHSMAAADKPISVLEAPLPLAETSSVFAEMLLNEKLVNETQEKSRKFLLAELIDDMYATIMRQAYFTIFEIDVHQAIAEENATIDEISELYLRNLRVQFGDSIRVSPEFKWEWLYISHFYHAPFYCYAYSFGNLLVLSLYQQYKREGSSFVPKYLKILAAGDSRKPEELLKESGIDISKDEFWQKGFDFVGQKVQQLKEL